MKNIVYAVRCIQTGELQNKRQSNPFYISEVQAKKGLEYCNHYKNWGDYTYELVKFELEEIKDEI